MPDGSYGGHPAGLLISIGDKNLYISGDTALTRDMELIAHWAPDLACAILPIGGHFTMDASDAALAAAMTGARKVIGCHFDTFAPIKIDHDRARSVFDKAGVDFQLPVIGEVIHI